MTGEQKTALIHALVALCQRNDLLPTDCNSLTDALQTLVSDELYISASELICFLED